MPPGHGDQQRRDNRDQSVAHREDVIGPNRFTQIDSFLQGANQKAGDDVDRGDKDGCQRVSLVESCGAVHGPVELRLARNRRAASPGLGFVDQPGIQFAQRLERSRNGRLLHHASRLLYPFASSQTVPFQVILVKRTAIFDSTTSDSVHASCASFAVSGISSPNAHCVSITCPRFQGQQVSYAKVPHRNRHIEFHRQTSQLRSKGERPALLQRYWRWAQRFFIDNPKRNSRLRFPKHFSRRLLRWVGRCLAIGNKQQRVQNERRKI
jgi:hypothetical protein